MQKGFYTPIGLKKINTVVLVDRSHSHFPVKADYVGLSLSTTLQERIEADLRGKSSSGSVDGRTY